MEEHGVEVRVQRADTTQKYRATVDKMHMQELMKYLTNHGLHPACSQKPSHHSLKSK